MHALHSKAPVVFTCWQQYLRASWQVPSFLTMKQTCSCFSAYTLLSTSLHYLSCNQFTPLNTATTTTEVLCSLLNLAATPVDPLSVSMQCISLFDYDPPRRCGKESKIKSHIIKRHTGA